MTPAKAYPTVKGKNLIIMKERLQKYCLHLNLLFHLLILITALISHRIAPAADLAILLLCFFAFFTAALYLASVVFGLPEIKNAFSRLRISALTDKAEAGKTAARIYLILFLALYFVLLFTSFLASISFVSFFPVLPMFLLPLCWYYLVLVSSSLYGIALILRMRREGILSRQAAALHIFLHLFFITDILDSTYIVRKAREYEAGKKESLFPPQ